MLNVVPMVITEKMSIIHTQKEMRKELKYFPAENQLSVKEDSSAGNEGQKSSRHIKSDRNKPPYQ